MSDALPETMTVIEIREYGGPEVLKPARRELPAPQPNEVLIQVAFAGVNRPDCARALVSTSRRRARRSSPAWKSPARSLTAVVTSINGAEAISLR